jgi:hypothetical protein
VDRHEQIGRYSVRDALIVHRGRVVDAQIHHDLGRPGRCYHQAREFGETGKKDLLGARDSALWL